MAHLALYRKYRSQTFDELVGQDHVVRTLRNAIAAERVAHAYLFTGPRGTGKTSTARLLAKCLCAPGGPAADPDPESEISRAIAAGSCVDVVEMDAASESGVDDIRTSIVEAAEYKPMMCPFKVYIIDEVHDLSAKAFDALLKTIEEPPPHVVFILATTEYNRVPATIRSRCQKFEFHRATLADLVARLEVVAAAEGIEAEPAALSSIARMADGGFRDALTLLEQASLTADGPITVAHVREQLGLVADGTSDRLLLAIGAAEHAEVVRELESMIRSGRDPRAILESLLHRLADLTRAIYEVEGAGDAAFEAGLRETAGRLGPATLLRIRTACAEALRAVRDVSLPRIWLESMFLALASAPDLLAPAARPSAPARKPANAAAPSSNPEPKTEPNPESNPERAAKPAAKPVAKLEQPEAEPRDEAPASPELAAAIAEWRALIEGLDSNLPHRMKLEGSTVAKLEGEVFHVSVSRKLMLDWFAERPQRLAYVRKLLRGEDRPERDVVLQLAPKTGAHRASADQAVELPAEGEALHQKVVEVFGSASST